MRTMPKWPAILVLALALGIPTLAAAGADGKCIASWSEAASLIRQEQLVVIEKLTENARDQLGGDIVKTTLCSKDGRYVYRLVVRSPGGPLKDVSVDARRPFGR